MAMMMHTTTTMFQIALSWTMSTTRNANAATIAAQ